MWRALVVCSTAGDAGHTVSGAMLHSPVAALPTLHSRGQWSRYTTHSRGQCSRCTTGAALYVAQLAALSALHDQCPRCTAGATLWAAWPMPMPHVLWRCPRCTAGWTVHAAHPVWHCLCCAAYDAVHAAHPTALSSTHGALPASRTRGAPAHIPHTTWRPVHGLLHPSALLTHGTPPPTHTRALSLSLPTPPRRSAPWVPRRR